MLVRYLLIIIITFPTLLHPFTLFTEQKVLKDYEEGKYNDVRDYWQKRQIDEPFNGEINYNLGVVNYRLKEYAKAGQSFERVCEQGTQTTDELKEQAYFNWGNTLYQQTLATLGPDWEKKKIEDKVLESAIGTVKGSIQKYTNALVLNKEDEKAVHNKKKAEELLQKLEMKKMQQQQQQQQDQNKDQNKDKNQDKNKDQNKDQNKGNQQQKDSDSGQNKDQNQNNDQNKGDQDQNEGNDQQKSEKNQSKSDKNQGKSDKDKSDQGQPDKQKGDKDKEAGEQGHDKDQSGNEKDENEDMNNQGNKPQEKESGQGQEKEGKQDEKDKQTGSEQENEAGKEEGKQSTDMAGEESYEKGDQSGAAYQKSNKTPESMEKRGMRVLLDNLQADESKLQKRMISHRAQGQQKTKRGQNPW